MTPLEIGREWRNLWQKPNQKEARRMPTYDYVCKKCDHQFEVRLTVEEHDKRKVECPKCHAKEVQQLPEAFFAITGKKS
jgi:putative FmdB family regulatory protein